MSDFWLRFLGVPTGRVPQGASAQFSFAHFPQSWGVFLLIGGVLAGIALVFYLYRREIATCPPMVRGVLAVLRMLVLLLLVLVALGPVLAYTTRHQVDPFVVLAIDVSKSMAAKDKYLDDDAVKPIAAALGKSPEAVRGQQPTRAELVQQLLTQSDNKIVRDLADKGRLRVVHFAEQADIKETKPRLTLVEMTKTIANRDASDITWPHLRWVVYVCLALVLILMAVAFIQSRALLALIAAIPLTVGFFSLVMFIEENDHVRPLALMGLAAVDRALGYDPEADAERAKQREAEQPREKPFDAELPPLNPAGRTTDIARAIRKALESTASGPVSGIVLVTDGRHTSAVEDVLKAAEEASDRNVPVFTVGVGDISRERRIEIAGVYANERVWRGDPFNLQAVVKAKGYQGRSVDVSLLEKEINESGDGKVLERKTISLPGDDAQEEIEFKHEPTREGEFKYVVRIENPPDPQVEGKREEFTTVEVLSDKARVLLVAGSPTWEYRMVQVLLQRDKTMNLSCWLQSIKDMPQEGTTKIEKLPLTKADLAEYDVVLLFDPDPADFHPAAGQRWDAVLRDFLTDGGGVLYMAGPKYTGQFLTDERTTGITAALPVTFGEQSTFLTTALTEQYNRPFRLNVVAANVDHAIMRFDKDVKVTLDRWQRMPLMYWSFPAKAAKTTGRVLLEHGDPRFSGTQSTRPLLVTGQYGAGRTVYMGFNGTWRWRRLGKDGEYFSKFWVQTVRYLIEGRLLGTKKRGTIELAKNKFASGEKVPITARLKTPAGDPLVEPQLIAQLMRRGERTVLADVTLKPVKDKPGVYQGDVDARQQGRGFHVSLELAGAKPGEMVTLTSSNFEVELSDVELDNRQLNKQLLKEVAERASSQYRGKYFEVDELTDLAAAIPDRTEVKTIPGRPIELWDSNRLWFVLVLLLTIEWGMRKRFKLM